jgi:DNA-binding response OmpR family regulator
MNFTALQPSSGADAVRREPRAQPRPAQQTWRLNALLVDDDPADTSLVLGILARHPNIATARAVDSPVLALRQLLAGYRKPDLVLLDIRMPRLDGFEFLEGLRKIPGMISVPVVFLTTSGAEKDVMAYMRSSASLYVIKPDTFEELHLRLDGIVERAISGAWSK